MLLTQRGEGWGLSSGWDRATLVGSGHAQLWTEVEGTKTIEVAWIPSDCLTASMISWNDGWTWVGREGGEEGLLPETDIYQRWGPLGTA